MAIDDSLAVVRLRLKRSVNNQVISPDAVTATPTVEHVTTDGHHGYHDLRPVTSAVDANNAGVLYLDLPATDDADVNEAFAWRITFQGSERPTRLVAVPQAGPAVETIQVDGYDMPAVWLDALADFTGYSGPTAPVQLTQAYVDTAFETHEAAPDPHPGYALESAVNPRLLPTAAADGQGVQRSGGTWVAADMATDAELTAGVNAAAADATAKVTAHRDAVDPHGDRAAASSALTGHVESTDPHGDRAAAITAIENHRTASDPHGDRAATTTAIENHRTTSDPHGDRAVAASALTTHTNASDPHGDRAAATAALAGHAGATDPHGDRAWATGQLAGKVDTTETDAAPGTASRRTLGAGANQALPGNHASTTDQRTPSDGSVTNAKVSTTAAIAESKLALASDAAAGTASRRTLGSGAVQAAAGNHTHGVDTLTATGRTGDGSKYLRDDNTWGVPPGTAGGLTPTSVKTGAYSANSGELVLVDATSAAITITAPSTGTGRAFGVKKVDSSTNVVTVAAVSGTTIGSGGGASIPVRYDDQATYFTYNPNTPTNWLVTHNHLPPTAVMVAETGTAFRAHLATTQAVANATDTVVSFPTVTRSSTLVTPSTQGAGHKFTLGRAGVWVGSVTVRMPSAASGEAYVAVTQVVSSATSIVNALGSAFGGATATRCLPISGYFESGTALYVSVFQSSGASQNIDHNSGNWCHIDLNWLRP